ncbi:hypothetical protein GCM10009593_04910 [Microlunatus antarcticus]
MTRVSATDDLIAAVQARAAGSPYAVEATAEGFDVRLAVEDPQWFGRLREWRLSQTSIQHVQVLKAARRLRITDEVRTLTWVAGTDGRERPTLGAALAVTKGRVVGRSFHRTYSLGRDGVTKESEVTFNAGAGRDLVLDAAKALGWRLQLSLNERIGLYVGVTTIVLLVLAGLAIGIVALAGGFS